MSTSLDSRRSRCEREPLRRSACALLCVASFAALMLFPSPVSAQSLEDRLDEDAFLRGLIDQGLPEVLEHYMETHPPDDPFRAAQFQIAAQQLRVRAATNPSQRLEALERLIVLRDQLIEEHRDHPRRSLWIADQASDLFFQLLPTEASGITALFGVPTAAQLQRAKHVAERMQTLASLADIELQRTLMDVEAQPGFERDEALQMQRRRIVRDERERRIPFLRGVAAVLAAKLLEDDPAEQTLLMEEAAALLEPLRPRLEGVVGARACLYAGLASLALDRHEQSASAFVDAAKNQESAIDALAGRIGQIRVVQVQEGAQAALAELDEFEQEAGTDADRFQRLLIADQRFLLRRAHAMELSGRARRDALEEAFLTYLDLLEGAKPDESQSLAAVVLEKLAAAADEDVPLEDLPAIVTVARGRRLSEDPQRSAEAIELLERALETNDLDERARAVAMFGLGRALYQEGRSQEAAERFLAVAVEHPATPEAEQSIQIAAAIGKSMHEQHPQDDAVRDFLARTLEVLMQRYPNLPSIDQWRYVAGRVAMSAGDHERAVASFRQISADAEQWPDAQFMLVGALRANAAASDDEEARAQQSEAVLAAADRATSAFRRAMQEADGARRKDLEYYLSFVLVMQAEALANLGRPAEAVSLLEELRPEDQLDSNVVAAAMRTRIAAHRAMGQAADAQQEIGRLLESSPDEASEILAAMLGGLLAEVIALEESGQLDAAQRRAKSEAVPLADLVASALPPGIGEPTRTTLLRRAAEAYRIAGHHESALEVYDRLLREQPNAVDLVLGRAESLYGMSERDHLAEAMRLYKRIAAAGGSVDRHYYWQSQLRMLQILDQVGRNTEKIAARIERLREEDRDLGGERYRRHFDELYNKYKRRR